MDRVKKITMTSGSRTKDECCIIIVSVEIGKKSTFSVLDSQGLQAMDGEGLNQVPACLADAAGRSCIQTGN
jgi:hypothetical protein